MLSIKTLRDNPKEAEKALQAKDPSITLAPLLHLDETLRALKSEVEALKSQRNQNAKQVGEKKRRGEEVSSLLQEMEGIGQK